MELNLIQRIGRGAQADIFRLADGGWVLKLYRLDPGDSVDRVTVDYARERAAYLRAHAANDLTTHVPEFGEPPRIERVLTTSGRDVTKRYVLTACLRLQFLAGKPRKYRNLPKSACSGLDSIVATFMRYEILVLDGSVFNWNAPSRARFIDINTRSFWGNESPSR